MVIYEVNLTVDADIYSDFQVWLKFHVREMIQFPGFLHASILKGEKGSNNREKLTVLYHIETREDLDKYFTEFAPQMRADGIRLFKNKFSAARRVFELEEIISK